MHLFKVGIECESIEGPESWGVGRIVKKLLEEIARRPELEKEFKFFLYFKSKIPDYPWLASPIFIKKTILGHSHILKNMRMNSFSLYYYICLPIKLWFEKLDLMFFPNYMLPILFRGKSLVMLTEDIYYEIHSGTLPWRYKLAYKIFAGWWAARRATKIMAISETSKNELTKLFKISPDRIIVNQLGISPPDHLEAKPPSDNSTWRLSLQTSNQQLETRNYLLYVGQAFPRRHLRETMLAFEKLTAPNTERLNLVEAQPLSNQPLSNLRLIAIGKDKYNPPIIGELVKKINGRLGHDAIIWKEYVPEDKLAALYANARLLIYVSSREAFGLPPLEALGYGVPAVVADQSITREIFGNHVFFVANPDDPNSITTAIMEGLADGVKREEIKNAREDILKKYTWQNHTERFLKICRNF